MNILDDQKTLTDYNKSNVAKTISLLPKQILESYTGSLKVKLPFGYKKFQQIVICGMGGSNLATELIRGIYGQDIKIPFVLVRNYNLPAFVNKKTLVIISSYSGGTEEAVSCLQEALNKKAKVIGVAGGGEVINLVKKNKIPYCLLDKKLNPANQPRYGVGLQLGTVLAILIKTGLLKRKNGEIKDIAEYLTVLNNSLIPEVVSADNVAKKFAEELFGHLPILVGADFLFANTHILNNQINESAKNLSQYHAIPELNHHLMEGLELPSVIKTKIKFLFFNSNLYSDRINKRFDVTEHVLKKQGIKFIDYLITGDSKLLASLEVLLLGSWISYYLTILNGQNPVSIPWVDYFKSELNKWFVANCLFVIKFTLQFLISNF